MSRYGQGGVEVGGAAELEVEGEEEEGIVDEDDGKGPRMEG